MAPVLGLYSGHVTAGRARRSTPHCITAYRMQHTPATIRSPLPGWLVQPEAKIRRLAQTQLLCLSSPVGSSDRKQRFVSDRNLLHPPHKAAGGVGESVGERLLAANLWLPWHEATRGRGRRTMHAGSAALRARTTVITECEQVTLPSGNNPSSTSVHQLVRGESRIASIAWGSCRASRTA